MSGFSNNEVGRLIQSKDTLARMLNDGWRIENTVPSSAVFWSDIGSAHLKGVEGNKKEPIVLTTSIVVLSRLPDPPAGLHS